MWEQIGEEMQKVCEVLFMFSANSTGLVLESVQHGYLLTLKCSSMDILL
jgi:hypothetical protein